MTSATFHGERCGYRADASHSYSGIYYHRYYIFLSLPQLWTSEEMENVTPERGANFVTNFPGLTTCNMIAHVHQQIRDRGMDREGGLGTPPPHTYPMPQLPRNMGIHANIVTIFIMKIGYRTDSFYHQTRLSKDFTPSPMKSFLAHIWKHVRCRESTWNNLPERGYKILIVSMLLLLLMMMMMTMKAMMNALMGRIYRVWDNLYVLGLHLMIRPTITPVSHVNWVAEG